MSQTKGGRRSLERKVASAIENLRRASREVRAHPRSFTSRDLTRIEGVVAAAIDEIRSAFEAAEQVQKQPDASPAFNLDA